MASNPKRWAVPFAAAGDRAAVPNDPQPSGSVSYQEGWGLDYERDPTTDPLAKRIPRDQSNQLAFDVTATLKAAQEQGLPWFISPSDNGGAPFPYIKGAQVLYDAAGIVSVYESLTDGNTALPTVAASWSRVDPARFATQAETDAGTSGSVMVAPRELSRAAQSGRWNFAVAGGSANALTVALGPAISTIPEGMPLRLKIVATNTGPVTLSVNGGAAISLRNANGGALVAGDLLAGSLIEAVFDGTVFRLAGHSRGRLLNVRVYSTAGVFAYSPTPGTDYVEVEVYGPGGGGAGVPATGVGETASGGGGGSGAYAYKLIRSGFSDVTVTVGAGGVGGAAGFNWGGNGATSSFGSLVSAPGGAGGSPAGPTSTLDIYYAAGGAGGAMGVGGDINVPGNGARAVSIANRIGDPPPRQPGMMMAGAGFGGEGKAILQNTAARAGETGGNGLVIVREYA